MQKMQYIWNIKEAEQMGAMAWDHLDLGKLVAVWVCVYVHCRSNQRTKDSALYPSNSEVCEPSSISQ